MNALNKLISIQGGLVATVSNEYRLICLEVAGLMSNKRGEDVLADYTDLSKFTSEFGSEFHSPFMTPGFYVFTGYT